LLELCRLLFRPFLDTDGILPPGFSVVISPANFDQPGCAPWISVGFIQLLNSNRTEQRRAERAVGRIKDVKNSDCQFMTIMGL
jgi:hypothetical protein